MPKDEAKSWLSYLLGKLPALWSWKGDPTVRECPYCGLRMPYRVNEHEEAKDVFACLNPRCREQPVFRRVDVMDQVEAEHKRNADETIREKIRGFERMRNEQAAVAKYMREQHPELLASNLEPGAYSSAWPVAGFDSWIIDVVEHLIRERNRAARAQDQGRRQDKEGNNA